MSIRKGTTIIAGNSSPLDWTGTLQEYNIALENGTIKENMVCYITDDTLYTDDIRPEIDRLDNVKANKDLSNLSEVGEKHFLNKSQITNCITEVPQRIKYTLVDGTITIKAGSVVIVPYGTEDLTSQYPVGSRFIHDNFKVYDTQYVTNTVESYKNKFFVWAEVQNDISRQVSGNGTTESFVQVSLTRNFFWIPGTNNSTSGSTDGTIAGGCYYNTSTNLFKNYDHPSEVTALPCMIIQGDGTYYTGKVNQAFNGFGYIGSTIWVDKGVKFLCPNGRNADGTLNNIERATNFLCLDSLLTVDRNYILSEYYMYRRVPTATFIQDNTPSLPIADGSHAIWFNTLENSMYFASTNETTWTKSNAFAIVGNASLSHFDFKQPFRAVDYNDKSEISGWAMPSNKYISVTLGASDTTYTAPANGYYQCYIGGSSGNKWLRLFTTGNYLQESGFSTSNNIGFTVPIKKGETLNVRYSGTLTVKNLIFIYAEGEA